MEIAKAQLCIGLRGQKIPPPPFPLLGAPRKIINQSSQVWPCYISIGCKFYVLSEKYKNVSLSFFALQKKHATVKFLTKTDRLDLRGVSPSTCFF